MAIDLDKGVSLSLDMKPGQTISYKITTKVQQRVIASGTVLNEQANEFFSKLSQRILAVDGDGSAHVVSTTSPYDGDGSQRQVIYQQLSSQGHVLETTGGVPSSAYSFPEDPVKLKDSWQGEVKLQIPTQQEPVVCISTYKVDGTEKVGDYECVRIMVESEEVEFQVPSPDGNGMANVHHGFLGGDALLARPGNFGADGARDRHHADLCQHEDGDQQPGHPRARNRQIESEV